MGSLPAIDLRVETLRLAYGSLLRLFLYPLAYYTGRGLFSQYVLRHKGSLTAWRRCIPPYVASQGLEIGVSLLICPVRYLAAVSTPRFMLDYMLTGWSEVLRSLDLFSPGKYVSYADYAFSSISEWNLDFFTWQVPAAVLTLAKVWYRRRRLGAQNCRTLRVLLMLPLQLFLRAYLSSFSIMLPETGEEALEAVIAVVLEGAVTSYIAHHTAVVEEREDGKLALVGRNEEQSEGSNAMSLAGEVKTE
uniref:Uncharacterized protein n=1 Tax=Trypanosoma congolense (strain IL3000) TaxID=1068625 RepID=G0UNW3_TRYCI|nr:conserved hypothetical protein [Trypanosoma congolense IL3000]